MSVAEKMCDFIFMIFKGRKVLDGTLAQIKQTYGDDILRVQVTGNGYDANAIAGVEKVNDFGQLQELRIKDGTNTQDVLQALMAQGTVTHFELANPSLHDIFVRIAGPEAAEAARESHPEEASDA